MLSNKHGSNVSAESHFVSQHVCVAYPLMTVEHILDSQKMINFSPRQPLAHSDFDRMLFFFDHAFLFSRTPGADEVWLLDLSGCHLKTAENDASLLRRILLKFLPHNPIPF
jgi:hypothetical protein